MKLVIALLLGVGIGAAAVWVYSTKEGKAAVQSAGEQIQATSKSAQGTVEEKLRVLHLRPGEIQDELAKTGQIVRREASAAGKAIADATADARTTAMIKAKLIGSHDLSALSISVNTTAGIVTLSGTVATPDDIGKAMLLAMDTDGVREVVSTLQVKPKPAKSG
jgi:osmotically-inducible protein OsmY